MNAVIQPLAAINAQIVSITCDHLNRYPGEHCKVAVKCDARMLSGDIALSLTFPKELTFSDVFYGSQAAVTSTQTTSTSEDARVTWSFDTNRPMIIEATLSIPTGYPAGAILLTADALQNGEITASETVQVKVAAEAAYLKYLPEIYAGNDFLSRFLMLFESFWSPIQQQIGGIEHYFDIDLAPPDFIPWLASWIGLVLDENLSDQRQRALLHTAFQLYQRRGTASALKELLQIYTGGDVEIREHRTRNLRLGDKAFLGHTVAIGTLNLPHTFSVRLTVDESEIQQDGLEKKLAKEKYARKVARIIESQKPAHTACLLELGTMKTSTPTSKNETK